MTGRTEIDRELAELEAMLDGHGKQVPETTGQKSRRPNWLVIVGLAAVIDLAARFFVPSSQSFVLVLEALVFAFAGGALLVPVIRRSPLSAFRKKVHTWLGAAFILGAIRSGMWGLGAPVEYANLTIFLLGLVGLGIAFVKRKRGEAE